jgi:hypothetical protein
MSTVNKAAKEAKSAIRLKFFEMLFGTAKGYICFATSDPRAPKTTFMQRFFEWPNESLKAENWILKVEQDHNVYFCINLLDRQERKKANCLPGNLLWADLDAVNPDTLKIPAPIVIRSSPGRWQAIWRMTTHVPPAQAQDYSHRIAYGMGADKSGWDLTQLLRVPLTTNFKYTPPSFIELDKSLEILAKPSMFEHLPIGYLEYGEPLVGSPPQFDHELRTETILKKYHEYLGGAFVGDFMYEPDMDSDWSEILWRLLHRCFDAGMSIEEVFVVAKDAKCNKYERDGRPVEHLWRDVVKASESYQFVGDPGDLIEMPELVESKATRTFLDDYRDWATDITDAVPDFHDISMLVILSAIVSSSVRIDSSAGGKDGFIPNIWGLILGESTSTRKSTAMGHALGFLREIDPDMIVAADATAEGLLQGISERPNLSSIFHKDEVSGLFDSMRRKDYMAGFQETLTQLYDPQGVYVRRLRKEVIRIEDPSFLILCGGTPNRVHASINDLFVLSGFLPRFLVVKGDSQVHRRLGPSKENDSTKRTKILNTLADLYENYACPVPQTLNGHKVLTNPRYMARLTTEAWTAWNDLDEMLEKAAQDSLIKELALPTMNRLGMSMLKMSAIFAAIRQRPGEFASSSPSIIVDVEDVLNAAWYCQKWGKNAIDLVINAGKSVYERDVERITEYIGEHPGVQRTEILRRFHLTAKDADMLMQTIEQRGLVRKEQKGRAFAYWLT